MTPRTRGVPKLQWVRSGACCGLTSLLLLIITTTGAAPLTTAMLHELPLSLLVLLHATLQSLAISLPDESETNVIPQPQPLKPRLQLAPESVQSQIRASNSSSNGTITSPNGTEFVWVIQDTFNYQNFFECVRFAMKTVNSAHRETVNSRSSPEKIPHSMCCDFCTLEGCTNA